MQQSVMRFPTASARSSAIGTVVAEGMVSYLDDTNAIEYYDGSAWASIGAGAATPTTQGLVYGAGGSAVTGTAVADLWNPVIYGYASGTAISFGPGISGTRNVIVGNNAARKLTSGYSNTVVGTTALNENLTGNLNAAIGDGALFSATSNNNVGVGASSGSSITTGGNNVVVGGGSGQFTTGGNNTVVGAAALAYTTNTGSNNTILGSFALSLAVDSMSGNNNTVLGYEAAPSTNSVSNQITLGNASVTSLRCNVTSISSLSDERDKTDIEELPVGLDFLKALRPVRFTWNTRIPEPVTYPDGTIREFTSADVRTGVEDMGFIAQDLVAAEDELDAHDWLQLTLRDNPEKLEATQGRLIPILVKAIQELSAKVELLESQVK
jgi:hypothetical protein